MPILLLFIFLSCAHVVHAETAESSNAPSNAPPTASASAAPVSRATGAGNGLIDAADLPAGLDDAAQVDFYCLRRAYPQITGMTTDAQGQWLVFNDGRRVLYDAAPGAAPSTGPQASEWVVSVRTSTIHWSRSGPILHRAFRRGGGAPTICCKPFTDPRLRLLEAIWYRPACWGSICIFHPQRRKP